MTDVRQGLVALGDSITRGRGGAPALGVHPQSWALWLAEALELPYTNLAIDGETAPGVVTRTAAAAAGPVRRRGAVHRRQRRARAGLRPARVRGRGGHDLGELTRRARADARADAAARPRPPAAGAKVPMANAILRDLAARHGATRRACSTTSAARATSSPTPSTPRRRAWWRSPTAPRARSARAGDAVRAGRGGGPTRARGPLPRLVRQATGARPPPPDRGALAIPSRAVKRRGITVDVSPAPTSRSTRPRSSGPAAASMRAAASSASAPNARPR